jgi:protein-arginine kinase activator protein McsA
VTAPEHDDCPRCRFYREVAEQAAGLRCQQCWTRIKDFDDLAAEGYCGTCYVTRRDGGRANRSKWDAEPKGNTA